MKKVFILIIIIVIAVGGWFLYKNKIIFSNYQERTSTLISQVSYLCNGGKTIEANYYQGSQVKQSQPGEPPIPTGSISLVLSDGRNLTLPQTISGSGVRYANSDESFIFWSKGEGAFILENDIQTYMGCVILASDTGGLTDSYVDSAGGFSIRYPAEFTVNTSYKYQELGPGKDINGVKFIIPEKITTGTNLSKSGTGISVEEILNIQECEANLFIYPPNDIISVTDNNVMYSVATTNGAGAGNFYEEKVWAIPGTNPCIAIRYFIHSTNIGNYTPGTVKEFDRQALFDQFDKIRRSLVINQ